ncbi:HupE/UreJ family protein [Pelomonas sp. KK5]|uniref:HupE/UreJ family protein n=1 Tax=Pelomonas sp. KK5 TaxID=1855730 RepID=UPI00097BFC37|nr:HupE/UreJ family protein [Pelomonas sp. KK5]
MKKNTLLIALTLCAAPAFAHVGADGAAHHHGFTDGLIHPFTGIDHLAAMLAVGIWSAGSVQRRWAAPLMFVAMLLAGALLARAGVAFPAVETMIAGSLLAAGALLLAPRQLPLGGLVMGGFALFHGAAHGVELAGYAALAGMVAGTAALHVLGIGLGLQMRRYADWLPRVAGAAIALIGLGLLA